jgi:hypothetical protein
MKEQVYSNDSVDFAPFCFVALSSVGLQDDEHFPVHNPADITVWARSEVSSPWTIQVNMTCPAADTTMVPVVKGPTTMRYWRLDIATRHNTPPSGTRVHARTSHTTAHIVSHFSNE